jgi:hypothetical protein
LRHAEAALGERGVRAQGTEDVKPSLKTGPSVRHHVM